MVVEKGSDSDVLSAEEQAVTEETAVRPKKNVGAEDKKNCRNLWNHFNEKAPRRESEKVEATQKTKAEHVAQALFDQQHFFSGANNARVCSKDFAERQKEWLEKKESRVSRLRAASVTAEQNLLQPPVINKSSQRMAKMAGRSAKYFCTARRTASAGAAGPSIPPNLFRPNINLNARRLEGKDDDVVKRLYADCAARLRWVDEQLTSRRQNELIDSSTGRPYFEPQLSRKRRAGSAGEKKKRSRSAAEATEALYINAAARRQQQQQQQENISKKESDKHVFLPELSKGSRKIVTRQKSREEVRPMSLPKVTTPKKNVKINLGDFLKREELALTKRQQRLESVERTLFENQQKECTFAPRINKRSVEIFESSQKRRNLSFPSINTVRSEISYRTLSRAKRSKPAKEEEKKCKIYNSASPSSRGADAVLIDGFGAVFDEEFKSLDAFEQKMKELLNEWRSFESF